MEQLTSEQKLHISFLLLAGKKNEAIEYAQQVMNISREEAVRFLNQASKQVPHPDVTEPITERERETFKRRGRRVAFLAVFVSVIMFGVVVYRIVIRYQFSRQAHHVQGVVVEIHESEHSYNDDSGTHSGMVYSPVFQYYVDGQSYQQEGAYTSSPGYELGEKVDVLVDPADAHKILVDTFRERWLVSMIFGIAGFVSIIIAWLANRFGW